MRYKPVRNPSSILSTFNFQREKDGGPRPKVTIRRPYEPFRPLENESNHGMAIAHTRSKSEIFLAPMFHSLFSLSIATSVISSNNTLRGCQ